jgi:hypothetical protein
VSANHIEWYDHAGGVSPGTVRWMRHPSCARWVSGFVTPGEEPPDALRVECVECGRVLPLRPASEDAA